MSSNEYNVPSQSPSKIQQRLQESYSTHRQFPYIFSRKLLHDYFYSGEISHLAFGPFVNWRASSNLVILGDDFRCAPFSDPRPKFGLERKFDDITIQKEPSQEVLNLIGLAGSAHVQHENAGFWLEGRRARG